MSIIIFYHTLYYFLIPISTIGYGLTLLYLGNNKKIEYNFGYSGLFGIFFLIAYSYLTHIFFPHGKIHNLILIIIGLFFFILFFITKIKKSKKKILLFLIAFITLYIGSFIFKTYGGPDISSFSLLGWSFSKISKAYIRKDIQIPVKYIENIQKIEFYSKELYKNVLTNF